MCRALPGLYPCRARGLPGPGLAGCEALPARVLPGLRNPLVFGSSDPQLERLLPAGLAGDGACRTLGLPARALPANAVFVLAMTCLEVFSQEGLLPGISILILPALSLPVILGLGCFV